VHAVRIRWVVTGSADETAHLWLLQMNDLINIARITVARNFFSDDTALTAPSFKGLLLKPPYKSACR
jgi:hypothetical protein